MCSDCDCVHVRPPHNLPRYVWYLMWRTWQSVAPIAWGCGSHQMGVWNPFDEVVGPIIRACGTCLMRVWVPSTGEVVKKRYLRIFKKKISSVVNILSVAMAMYSFDLSYHH